MSYNIIKNTIVAIFDQFIDARVSDFKRTEGGYFVIKIDGDNMGYEKNGNTYHKEWRTRKIIYLHIIILSAKMVFTCVSDDHKVPSPDKWLNTSNHDSCWREDGLREITNLYFSIHDEIHKNTPQEHTPTPVMGAVDFRLNHGWLFGPVFKCVSVDYKPLSYEDSYHKQLISINLIEKQLTVKI